MKGFWSAILIACGISLLVFARAEAAEPRVVWQGAAESELEKSIPEIVVRHRAEMKKAEVSLSGERQTQEETGIIQKKLRSEGYYSAVVTAGPGPGGYTIAPGARFRIGEVILRAEEGVKLPPLDELKVKKGDPLRAEAVLEAMAPIAGYVDSHNCLYDVKVEYEASINRNTAQGEVVFIVKESPAAAVGDISFEGLKTIKRDFALRKLDLKKGKCFRRTEIAKARQRLYETNLFSHVDADVLPLEGGRAPVRLKVTERAHRTVKAGVQYDSQNGPGVAAGWEHRNIFGGGQKLETLLKVSGVESSLFGGLTFPYFLSDKQSLLLTAKASHEETDAFDTDYVDLRAALQRKLNRYLTGSLGAQYKIGKITDAGGKEDVGLFAIPLGLAYDRRDNILDPRGGYFLSAEVKPAFDTLDQDTSFVKSTARASAYYTPDMVEKRITLAGRVAAGVIAGVGTATLPADERFYAGGGDSVRGYGFQQLGPVTAGIPQGGRSFMETSLETRFRVKENWGGAVFIDGGNVYDEDFTALGKDLRWAAGAGVRYYTGFAPVRLDIAVPLDKRRGDDAFQVYVSLGQAF